MPAGILFPPAVCEDLAVGVTDEIALLAPVTARSLRAIMDVAAVTEAISARPIGPAEDVVPFTVRRRPTGATYERSGLLLVRETNPPSRAVRVADIALSAILELCADFEAGSNPIEGHATAALGAAVIALQQGTITTGEALQAVMVEGAVLVRVAGISYLHRLRLGWFTIHVLGEDAGSFMADPVAPALNIRSTALGLGLFERAGGAARGRTEDEHEKRGLHEAKAVHGAEA